MPSIEIFSAPMCGACEKAKDYFASRGLDYTEHSLKWAGEDWEDSPTARDYKRRCGDMDFVPQIFIDGRHIKGWAELSSLIDSGEIDSLLTS